MPIDPGTATIAASVIGGLFGGGGGEVNPAADAQARILNWLFKNGLKQYMPGIFDAYSAMMNNPEQSKEYLLYKQALDRQTGATFQNTLSPMIMDLARRGVLDSSMAGQGVSNAMTRSAVANSQQLADVISSIRNRGLSGLQGAVQGATSSGTQIAGGFTPVSQAYESNSGNFMSSLMKAAQAYGASQTNKTPAPSGGGSVSYTGNYTPSTSYNPNQLSGQYFNPAPKPYDPYALKLAY